TRTARARKAGSRKRAGTGRSASPGSYGKATSSSAATSWSVTRTRGSSTSSGAPSGNTRTTGTTKRSNTAGTRKSASWSGNARRSATWTWHARRLALPATEPTSQSTASRGLHETQGRGEENRRPRTAYRRPRSETDSATAVLRTAALSRVPTAVLAPTAVLVSLLPPMGHHGDIRERPHRVDGAVHQ